MLSLLPFISTHKKMRDLNIVLIFGSAPDVTAVKQWDLSFFTSCVAINNAWQVLPDWNYLIFPEDFPIYRRPQFFDSVRLRMIDDIWMKTFKQIEFSQLN